MYTNIKSIISPAHHLSSSFSLGVLGKTPRHRRFFSASKPYRPYLIFPVHSPVTRQMDGKTWHFDPSLLGPKLGWPSSKITGQISTKIDSTLFSHHKKQPKAETLFLGCENNTQKWRDGAVFSRPAMALRRVLLAFPIVQAGG